jgi:Kef-type K+ transport system membrane component KefB
MAQNPEDLLLELFAIFVAAKMLGEFSERLHTPGVLGEIAAGVILGTFALGLVHASDTLHSIGEMGAIFVLFSAGLETSAHSQRAMREKGTARSRR